MAHELLHKHLRLGPSRGYAYQLLAGLGWTSLPILPMIRQQTLILAGSDDPIIPLVNARIMQRLLPHADLLIYDDGHLGLLTRAPELGRAVTDFLSRAQRQCGAHTGFVVEIIVTAFSCGVLRRDALHNR